MAFTGSIIVSYALSSPHFGLTFLFGNPNDAVVHARSAFTIDVKNVIVSYTFVRSVYLLSGRFWFQSSIYIVSAFNNFFSALY